MQQVLAKLHSIEEILSNFAFENFWQSLLKLEA